MPPEVKSAAEAQRLAEHMGDAHGVLNSTDKTCLFYRYWPATRGGSGRVIVVLHGIGYYSGPYKVIADALNARGVEVYAMDARGHGLSCGRRGYTGSPAQVAQDVESMMQFVRQQRPSSKIFLLGESMGGAYALDYVKDHSDQIAGLILLAPAINASRGQLFRLSNLWLLPYFLFAPRKPAISLVGQRLTESSRDPKFIAERRSDPLAYKKVSFGYLRDIEGLVKDWKTEIAPRLGAPMLMIQGGRDKVVSHKDCVTLHRLAASTDKEFKVFPDAFHTTLWDPETPNILQAVGDWVVRH